MEKPLGSEMPLASGEEANPYHDERLYHKAKLIDAQGRVSPLCAKRPRALSIEKHELWTNDWAAVTCKKCLELKDG